MLSQIPSVDGSNMPLNGVACEPSELVLFPGKLSHLQLVTEILYRYGGRFAVPYFAVQPGLWL